MIFTRCLLGLVFAVRAPYSILAGPRSERERLEPEPPSIPVVLNPPCMLLEKALGSRLPSSSLAVSTSKLELVPRPQVSLGKAEDTVYHNSV